MFVYTGKNMEPWSDKIASSINSSTVILDVSKNISLIKTEEDNTENGVQELSHDHEYDPHIWLDPQNAIIMVNNITEELCDIDSKNADYYKKNAESYIKQLNKLDSDIQTTIQNSSTNKIAFGGTFAYMYFISRYNLEYVTAYDSCGEDTEPSVSNVKKVIDYIQKNNLPVIFYQELSSGKIADSISAETGAKKLVFHTIHNVSQEELSNGETYISLMEKNLENLKIALN
jgi:zinc transport system substrate-binding protein